MKANSDDMLGKIFTDSKVIMAKLQRHLYMKFQMKMMKKSFERHFCWALQRLIKMLSYQVKLINSSKLNQN